MPQLKQFYFSSLVLWKKIFKDLPADECFEHVLNKVYISFLRTNSNGAISLLKTQYRADSQGAISLLKTQYRANSNAAISLLKT